MNISSPAESMHVILFAGLNVLQLVVILGILLFALARIRRYAKPATYLAAGLTVILVGRLLALVTPLYLSRAMAPDNFGIYAAISSEFVIFVETSGLILMAYAVFVSRSESKPIERPEFKEASNRSRDSGPNLNPYSSPPDI